MYRNYRNLAATLDYCISDFQQYILSRYSSGDNRWENAHQLIQKIADFILDDLDPEDLPINPLSASSILNIKIFSKPQSSSSTYARLYPTTDGLEMILYTNSGKLTNLSTFERFTVAHEYGHSFFYSKNNIPPTRLIPCGLDKRSKGYNREEGLCRAFAGAFLIPSIYKNAISTIPPSLEKLFRLSKRFAASPQATLIRIIRDFSLWHESVFYKFEFKLGKLHNLHTFRGANRRMHNDIAPTNVFFKKEFSDMNQDEIFNDLLHQSSKYNVEIMRTPSSIWLKL